MPKFWVLKGVKKGILTSRFPRKAPTAEEIPERSVPPVSTEGSDWTAGEKVCPTGAILTVPERRIELGRCIYCRRCERSGFVFNGEGDSSRITAMQASIAHEAGLDKSEIMQFERRRKIFKRSLHILMIDVGSCNACNLEVLNLSNPYYDLNRLGIYFTNSPKHADALVVVGALNKAMLEVFKRTYESMPEPKLVISVGACSISGGIFQGTEGFVSPIRDVVPVDVTIPGCPPSPTQIMEGLLMAMGKIDKERLRITIPDNKREALS